MWKNMTQAEIDDAILATDNGGHVPPSMCTEAPDEVWFTNTTVTAGGVSGLWTVLTAAGRSRKADLRARGGESSFYSPKPPLGAR